MFIRNFVHQLGERLSEPPQFMQVVMGPRQVGKTTGLKSVLEQWPGATVYASADLPAPPDAQWIIDHWQQARLKGAGTLLVLDEIQKVPRWSEVVKGLFDQDRDRQELQVVLLGSASISLQSGLSESLLGRYELIRVPHWDLYECKAAFEWNLDTFLQYGGYPAPSKLIHQEERWKAYMRDSVIEPLIARDILALKQISNSALFRQTFELAMNYPAQELSYQKMLRQLQDRGNAATIKSYLLTLEQAFVLRVLEKYSVKPIKTKSSSPKLIPLCPALVHGFCPPGRVKKDPAWRGRVFEAAVVAKTAAVPGELYYWRSGRYEVDFVWCYNDQVLAVEIKSEVKNAGELSGLKQFRERFPQSKTVCMDSQTAADYLASEDALRFLNEIYERC